MSCIGGKALGETALVVCPCGLDGTGKTILPRFSHNLEDIAEIHDPSGHSVCKRRTY